MVVDGKRTRTMANGILSAYVGEQRVRQLDALVALRRCSRSALIRAGIDTLLARFARVEVTDEEPTDALDATAV